MVTDGVILKFAKSGAGSGQLRYVRPFGMDSGAKVKNSHTKKGGDEKQEAGQELFLGITHSELPSKIFSSVAEGEHV